MSSENNGKKTKAGQTHGIMTRPRFMVSGRSTLNHDTNQWASTSCSISATRAPLWKKSENQFTRPSPG